MSVRFSIVSLLAATSIIAAGAAQSQQRERPAVGPVGVAPPIQPDAKVSQVQQEHTAYLSGLTPVTDQMLLNPPPGDWLQWRRSYDEHGFSPLTQIDRQTAGSLQYAWAWSVTAGTTQVTPLEHDGVLFIYAAGGRVQALNAVTGDLLWEYDRPPPPEGTGRRTAEIHRNFAIYGNNLYLATDDKHEIALDAKTGKLVWDHEFADAKGWNIDIGPLMVKGKLIQGTEQCAAGGCPIIALDANDGHELWRFYTVAHSDQPGGNSWNGLPDDQRFGASVWTTGSYDPELNLIYFGTGNTYHWQELMKGGPDKKSGTNRDGLYVDSTIALNPDTGKLAWYYQHLPQDYWDLDFAFEQTIATMNVDGKQRKLVCSTGKMVWTDCVDAATGKFVFSQDEGLQNIVKSYDPKTGRKTYNEQAIPDLTGQRRDVQCSAGYGDKNWPSGSYDTATGITYESLVEVCGESAPTMFGPNTAAYTAGEETRIARYVGGSDGNIGRLDAVNWATKKVLWSIRQRASITSAVVATAGGVIFAGDADRWFRAYDQTNGKVLWQTRLNDAVNAFPITYSVKGHQYVAVVTGVGGGRLANMHQLTPEIQTPRATASTLYVFALPESAAQ